MSAREDMWSDILLSKHLHFKQAVADQGAVQRVMESCGAKIRNEDGANESVHIIEDFCRNWVLTVTSFHRLLTPRMDKKKQSEKNSWSIMVTTFLVLIATTSVIVYKSSIRRSKLFL